MADYIDIIGLDSAPHKTDKQTNQRTNMKTDLELQKMLAEELPELIITRNHPQLTMPSFWWQDTYTGPDPCRVNNREWLWIVAECEKKLNICTNELEKYFKFLDEEVHPVHICWGSHTHDRMCATWQQRATAYLKTIGKL